MKKIISLLTIVVMLFISGCGASKSATLGSAERDGSSFEKAIIVSSVSEEYEYVRKDCHNCNMLRQSLVFEKKKPYDILTLEKPDGEQVDYYFDISKFYGKW
ncbi:MAG: hypothetical protein ABFR62_12645 [Bacteroidota bacterium]